MMYRFMDPLVYSAYMPTEDMIKKEKQSTSVESPSDQYKREKQELVSKFVASSRVMHLFVVLALCYAAVAAVVIGSLV